MRPALQGAGAEGAPCTPATIFLVTDHLNHLLVKNFMRREAAADAPSEKDGEEGQAAAERDAAAFARAVRRLHAATFQVGGCTKGCMLVAWQGDALACLVGAWMVLRVRAASCEDGVHTHRLTVPPAGRARACTCRVAGLANFAPMPGP